MRLVGVPLAHEHARLLGRGGVKGLGLRRGLEALEQLIERPVVTEGLEVADGERRPLGGRPAAAPEGQDAVAGEGVAQMLGGPQHGAPQRVIAEYRLVDEVLGDRRRLVLGARDLLDDHAPLPVELVGVDLGAGHEIGEQIGGVEAALRAGGDVEGDEIVAGVGVEHGADALGRLVDVAVGRVLLARP